jgi:hypothetical protein
MWRLECAKGKGEAAVSAAFFFNITKDIEWKKKK